jgi:FMN phosphatase YigB (HAD superfamily)
MKRVLLLDYDGVILRNSHANNLIAQRAGYYTRYVSSVHNKFMVDAKVSQDLCYNLYKGFGHTLLGIDAVGFHHKDVSLKSYNGFVYSHVDYNELTNANNDMADVHSVFTTCKKNNIDVFVFSNSPKVWIQNTLKKQQHILHHVEDIRDVLGVDDDDALMLKPLPKIYDMIDDLFKEREIVFVDDSACNLQYTLTKSNWTNVLYCGLNCTTSKNMHMINNLARLHDIIV